MYADAGPENDKAAPAASSVANESFANVRLFKSFMDSLPNAPNRLFASRQVFIESKLKPTL
jgi:hypothetical protein